MCCELGLRTTMDGLQRGYIEELVNRISQSVIRWHQQLMINGSNLVMCTGSRSTKTQSVRQFARGGTFW